MSSETTSPLTFDLQQDLLDKLKHLQEKVGARSLSEIVRYAVSVFDFSDIDLKASVHRQISVRLSSELRQQLTRLSQQKQVSVGELLRAALESLPPELSDFNPKKTMPKKKTTTKKATKKIAQKAPAKKAVKKKVAPKKATKKTVAKKAAPKKKVVKKAIKKVAKKVVKKAAPKKAVKKAAPKKAVKKAAPKKAVK
ncbi:MAG: CopG family transcriptional regulator, partial [Opitutae bacterium]|nr:CopG family transcriptional regulator [Opitutae bacterium]